MVAEGVKAARLVLELADRHGVQMPIASHIHDVIEGKETPIDAFAGLLPPGHELDAG
jgi:glycerol-3-phosphate dehydrogenase (NAD(P)+)